MVVLADGKPQATRNEAKLRFVRISTMRRRVIAFVARRNGRNLLACEAYFLFLVLFLFYKWKEKKNNITFLVDDCVYVRHRVKGANN